jgi:hypothetical protein
MMSLGFGEVMKTIDFVMTGVQRGMGHGQVGAHVGEEEKGKTQRVHDDGVKFAHVREEVGETQERAHVVNAVVPLTQNLLGGSVTASEAQLGPMVGEPGEGHEPLGVIWVEGQGVRVVCQRVGDLMEVQEVRVAGCALLEGVGTRWGGSS